MNQSAMIGGRVKSGSKWRLKGVAVDVGVFLVAVLVEVDAGEEEDDGVLVGKGLKVGV